MFSLHVHGYERTVTYNISFVYTLLCTAHLFIVKSTLIKMILSVSFENNSDIYGLLFVESMFICCGLIRWVSASHISQCYDKWSGIMGNTGGNNTGVVL